MPRTKTPASKAEETEGGRRRPVDRPKGEGMSREVSEVEAVSGGVPKLL